MNRIARDAGKVGKQNRASHGTRTAAKRKGAEWHLLRFGALAGWSVTIATKPRRSTCGRWGQRSGRSCAPPHRGWILLIHLRAGRRADRAWHCARLAPRAAHWRGNPPELSDPGLPILWPPLHLPLGKVINIKTGRCGFDRNVICREDPAPCR